MRGYDYLACVWHIGCTRYIPTIIITLVSVKSVTGSHSFRAEGMGEQSPVSLTSWGLGLLFCSPWLLTSITYLGTPSLCFLVLVTGPSVHASLASSQNFLAPRMFQSLSQNWLYFLSSKSK